MPRFIILLQLGCSESQVAGTGPGIAETTGAQEDGVQACQLLDLPATKKTVNRDETSRVLLLGGGAGEGWVKEMECKPASFSTSLPPRRLSTGTRQAEFCFFVGGGGGGVKRWSASLPASQPQSEQAGCQQE